MEEADPKEDPKEDPEEDPSEGDLMEEEDPDRTLKWTLRRILR